MTSSSVWPCSLSPSLSLSLSLSLTHTHTCSLTLSSLWHAWVRARDNLAKRGHQTISCSSLLRNIISLSLSLSVLSSLSRAEEQKYPLTLNSTLLLQDCSISCNSQNNFSLSKLEPHLLVLLSTHQLSFNWLKLRSTGTTKFFASKLLWNFFCLNGRGLMRWLSSLASWCQQK